MTHPRSAFGAPPQGGACSGPAKPDPRKPLGKTHRLGVGRHCKGFTLVELLVVALIGGVLVSALLQAFATVRANGRRADAADALLALQSAQERHHFRHGRYAVELAELRQSATSRQGHWRLTLRDAGPAGYLALAEREVPDADTGCSRMSLQVQGDELRQHPPTCWGR